MTLKKFLVASHLIMPYHTGEALAGPYVWGRYDLLVLPPSFPYGEQPQAIQQDLGAAHSWAQLLGADVLLNISCIKRGAAAAAAPSTCDLVSNRALPPRSVRSACVRYLQWAFLQDLACTVKTATAHAHVRETYVTLRDCAK